MKLPKGRNKKKTENYPHFVDKRFTPPPEELGSINFEKILRGSPSPTFHLSCVIGHISCVTCFVSCGTCYVSRLIFHSSYVFFCFVFFLFFFRQSGEASRLSLRLLDS